MQTSPFKYLPVILVLLALVGAFVFAQRRQEMKKQLANLLNQGRGSLDAKLSDNPFEAKRRNPLNLFPTTPDITLTPTPSPTQLPQTNEVTPTPTSTLTPTPTSVQSKAKKAVATKTVTVCTPVYGMANSCAEHTVVDTGLETDLFGSLALGSYLGGLVAFIKSKRG